MLRFLLLILLFFVFYMLLRLVFPSPSGRKPSEPEKMPQGEEMVRDPHCGTYIPLSSSIKKVVKGRLYYFCSEECRNAFKAME